MIIVRLKGGLGNQMFQYAFGRNLAIRNNSELKLDLSYLNDRKPKAFFIFRDFELDIFEHNSEIANDSDLLKFDVPGSGYFERRNHLKFQNSINEFNENNYYYLLESKFDFMPEALNFPKNSYIDGYWQSEKYFYEIANSLRGDFKFKFSLDDHSNELEKYIQDTNSVCIHVRYGYLKNFRDKFVHGFVGLNYINSAIKIIKQKVNNPKLFIFSDYPDWCQENIKTDLPVSFPELEYPGLKNHEYFKLISQCKHYVISNSSFSWWGAWLSDNPDKIVIAPKKWFRLSLNNTKDLCPQNWIRI
jgi:hypothetical protein